MNKKTTIAIGIMLSVILCLQFVIISRINRVYEDMISSDNFASQRIDTITSNIHELRNILENMIDDK